MNTRTRKEFLKMVDSYLAGTADAKQSSIVEQYFDLFSTEPDILEDLNRVEIEIIHDRLRQGINNKIDQYESKPSIILPWKYVSVAAALICILSIGIYIHRINKSQLKHLYKKSIAVADIGPGSNKAILTLANGSKVSLTDVPIGELAKENGVNSNKTKDGRLVYDQPSPTIERNAFNTIETPKGGQYQLILSDGTKVWLNAFSSLKYPLIFSNNERKVELTGEAYFEVVKNKSKPFRVFTDRQKVEVLGTHFDISAYPDESSTQTSLMEGSVQVSNLKSQAKIVIRPGQQSILTSAQPNILVKNLDVDDIISWKNGYFTFDEEPLESILRKISRWYDVDVEYQGLRENNKLAFSGTLSRYSNVSKVLKKLELTGAVHFKIDGRKIIVTP